MKRKISILFLVLSATFISAQPSKITNEDFNNDGIIDKLECFKEFGSNFGGADCKIKDGKTQKVFELSYYGCYCEIKNRVVVSSELQEAQNASFLKTLRKEMLPPLKSTPDASLKWIIASSYATSKIKDSSYFEFIFNPKTKWQDGEIEFPSTYTIAMNADSLSRIIPKTNDSLIRSKTANNYLVYSGKSHLAQDRTLPETIEFDSVAANDAYQILKTKHGVLAKKGAAHKWLFVTDMHINSSPQKLRWESIEEVILLDDYVIIKQHLAPDPEYALYIVAIETGIGGRIKINFDILLANAIDFLALSTIERFSIKDDTILIGNQTKTIRLPLVAIKKQLDSFYKSE